MKRPSIYECVQGFERILDKINPQQMTMLRAHYHSAGRAATMRELATAAGYGDFKMANLQYGNLAKRLYQAIGYAKPKSPRSGKEYWILGLGEFIGRQDFGLEMQCVMRPEVAEALERLGIVDSSGTSVEEIQDESSEVTVVEDEEGLSSQSADPMSSGITQTSDTRPIRVDFIRSETFPFLNRLGMTFAPGMSLLEESELERLQIGDLAEEGDIILIRLQASADASVPKSMTDLISMAAKFEKALRRGEIVIVHCKDKPEFVGLTAACIAIAATDAEISADAAIKLVRDVRPGAVETEAQEEFVAAFEEEWREVIENRGEHYFLHWQERSVLEHAANELPLDVVASNGLFGVERGDTLWIITLTQEREFFLAGRMVVGEVVEYEEAMRRMPDAGLWQAEYYAFPEPGTEEFLRPIPLTEIAEELRFDGDNDRLTVRDGQINPQQLRQRRKLTPETAELITRIWEESAPITDPEELVAGWQEVVEANPDDPHAHYNLAVALNDVGRSEEAAREYQTTIRLDPDYFPALYNLGNHLVHSQRLDEAIEMFNRAILVDGDYAPAHFMLAVAYFESGRFDDAIAATRQGLEIDADDESAYYNIAYWTFQQGDHRGAIARCDDVIARFPYFTSPHVVKGMCFRELGELDNEIESYKNAFDIKVDDEGALIVNFTALFFLGAAWERKITGSDEGIEYINADNHVDLGDPLHHFCLAMGHLAQGEREFADRFIQERRTSAPDLVRRMERVLET